MLVKKLFCAATFICLSLVVVAQSLPSCVSDIEFYTRDVHSRGAFPSKEQTYGQKEETQPGESSISKQYFLYVVNKCCKKLEITSLSIDGINYEYELVKVSSPVAIPDGNGGEQVLIAKTKNKVYQVKLGKPIFIQNQKAMKPNNYVSLEGKVKGKNFHYASTAKTLRSLKAQ